MHQIGMEGEDTISFQRVVNTMLNVFYENFA